MAEIEITFPDRGKKKFKKGVKGDEIAKKMKKEAIAVKVNGQAVDLRREIEENAGIEFIEMDSEEGIDVVRHSASHVMAEAVKALWKEVKLGIGPTIEDGFYYDFLKKEPFTEKDLKKIEEKMREIIKKNEKFKRKEVKREEAIKLFEKMGEKYKVELLNEMSDETVSIYESGKLIDLCRGPHVPSTKYIKAFRLLKVAGAYWKGNEENEMLQRIYGTAFASEKEMNEFLKFREEAEKRDHRKIGKELDLFSFNELIGSGLVLFHPKGAILRTVIEDFLRKEHWNRGYVPVYIPHLFKAETWKKSGHYDYYKEHMYFLEIEGQEYGVKPMNCPGHLMIYNSRQHSYKEYPIRYFELGTVYRYEKSGVLGGLFRVRGFTQDDAHIFCTPEQLKDELKKVVEFALDMMKTFGFEYSIKLSTRPEKRIGSDEQWDKAEQALKEALDELNLGYELDEGEGVFYGPKIDVKMKDAIGREWQGPTIQVDFNLPERFDVNYIGADSKKHRAIMIHRTVLGSMERFIGVLTEHYAGKFPLWLSPVQVVVISISEKSNEYAGKVNEELMKQGFRSNLDVRSETVSYKVRDAEMHKIPFILNVGEKEEKSSTVAVRDRSGKVRMNVKMDELIKEMNELMKEKK